MKFILTHELGRLAKWLRILGFDAAYLQRDKNQSELIIESLREDRIILARGQRIGKGRTLRLVRIRHDRVRDQLRQVLTELNIRLDEEGLFTRCVLCNKELEEIQKQKVKAQVPKYVYDTQEDFVICPECQRVYWQGTHWGNVRELIESVTGSRSQARDRKPQGEA